MAYYCLTELGEPRPSRLVSQRRLQALVSRLRPELIHCALPDASLASRLVAWRQKLPLIETLVNISHEPVRTEGNPNVTNFKLGLHRLLDRLTTKSVTRFQAISRAVADSWSRTVGLDPARITIIPRGIDVGAFFGVDRDEARIRVRHELALSDEALLLLNVGREQPQKGQRFLIEAMPAIVAEIPEAILLIAGSPGSHSRMLREMANGLGASVHFLGRRNDIAEFLAASDIFVFPSLYEGLGVSLLEAMAAGRAIVATDRPPMNEVIRTGSNGLLVQPGDPGDIAAAILRLARDPAERQRLGDAARRDVGARFSIEHTSARVERLYCEMLGI